MINEREWAVVWWTRPNGPFSDFIAKVQTDARAELLDRIKSLELERSDFLQWFDRHHVEHTVAKDNMTLKQMADHVYERTAEKVDRLELELERAKGERNAEGVRQRAEYLPKLEGMGQEVKALRAQLAQEKSKLTHILTSAEEGTLPWWQHKHSELMASTIRIGERHDQARKALKLAREALEWQRIDTAPRDGTRILVCSSEGTHVEVCRRAWERWMSAPGDYNRQPTFWLPIPSLAAIKVCGVDL